MEAFADDKININQKPKFILQRVENIMEKGVNRFNNTCDKRDRKTYMFFFFHIQDWNLKY